MRGGRMEARPTPTYNTPFTREEDLWGARTMLTVQPRHPDVVELSAERDAAKPRRRGPPSSRVSVVSYNVLADCNSDKVPHCPPSVTNWARRREMLLKEIFSVRADILCLQDVDFFQQWWGPQLTCAGYDSLFKQRTCAGGVHREGVMIAWKRDVFDLFRSGEVELNGLGQDEEVKALAGKAATSDDVALMVLLRPWQDSEHPSGACVVSTQLHEEQTSLGEDVRCLQARGLTRTIEAFNVDFQLPIILCGSMNCLPSSGTYEILCNGVRALDPAKPGPAGKPSVEALSTSTARVCWLAPPEDSEALSPPIDVYQILWVPGGSRFLSGESTDVRESDCLMYDLVETDSGNVKTVQNPFRSFIVTGLSSGVAYEFRVSAINALGQGPWGERSEPIRMPMMEGNDPEDKVLLSAASIKLLRKRELAQAEQRAEARLADPRVYELRKLVKVHGLVNLDFEKSHPFDSVSGLTPRYADAALHPDLANARTDAGYPVIDSPKELDSTEGVKTGRSRRRGRKKAKGFKGNSLDANSTGDQDTCSTSSGQSCGTSGSLIGAMLDDGRTAEVSLYRAETATTDAAGSTGGRTWESTTDCNSATRGQQHMCVAAETKKGESQGGHWLDRSCTAQRWASLKVTGARSTRQQHALGLRSAYMTHWAGGEPPFTSLSDNLSGTVDYIFFSAQSLLPGEVLSLPEMGDLIGRDDRQTKLAPNAGFWTPNEWNDNPEDKDFAGEWSPYLTENPQRVRHRIPNEMFPSNHLMLMVNLYYSEPNCPSSWR